MVKSGQLVVTGSGAAASLSIDGNALPFVPSARDGPFKKVGMGLRCTAGQSQLPLCLL